MVAKDCLAGIKRNEKVVIISHFACVHDDALKKMSWHVETSVRGLTNIKTEYCVSYMEKAEI